MKKMFCAVLAMMVCFTLFIGCEEKIPELEPGETYETHKEPKPNRMVDQFAYESITHESMQYARLHDFESSLGGPGQLIKVYRAKTGEIYRTYAWLGVNGERIEIVFNQSFGSKEWSVCQIISNMAPEASEEPKPVANPNVRAVEKAYLAKMKEHGYDYEPLEEIEAMENFVEGDGIYRHTLDYVSYDEFQLEQGEFEVQLFTDELSVDSEKTISGIYEGPVVKQVSIYCQGDDEEKAKVVVASVLSSFSDYMSYEQAYEQVSKVLEGDESQFTSFEENAERYKIYYSLDKRNRDGSYAETYPLKILLLAKDQGTF